MARKGVGTLVVVFVLLASLATIVARAGPSTVASRAVGGPPAIFLNLTTKDLMFDPTEFRVPPKANVSVRITQLDKVPHTFTVANESDFEIPTGWTPSELDAYLDGNNRTDTPIPAGSGTVVWANFTAPDKKGRYEFVCRIPGHFQAGMFGFLVVEQREVFVNITTQGIKFVPAEFTVPPNALVHVRITQQDAVEHTFTVGAEPDFVLPSNWSNPQVDAYMDGKNLTDTPIPAGSGTVVWANFTAPAVPGRYEFVCRIAGHFQAGMVGFMVVSEVAPPPPGFQLPLIPGIMLGTIIFVLLFAAVYHVRAVRAHHRLKPR